MSVAPPKSASWSYAESFVAEDDVLAAARARADEVGVVAIGSGGGAALRFLASVIEARAVVEVGTGTGVSGLWLLRGMRSDGILTTVDIEAEHQRLARETFTEGGVAPQRARTIAGAALDVLPRLTDGHYDLVFCDGDKAEYGAYLKEALRLLRPGGVVAFDNALWHDRVADPVAARRGDRGRSATSARRSPPTSHWCRCCSRSATACSSPRRNGPRGLSEDGPIGRSPSGSPQRTPLRACSQGSTASAASATGRKPAPPSAIATTAHASIRTGGLPMICDPGASAAPAVNVSWNAARAASSANT